MKILVEGDLKRTLRLAHFICTGCGCIWEADKNEYEEYELPGAYEMSMKCPTCGRIVCGKLGKYKKED